MYEQQKLDEAEYFYDRMLEEFHEPKPFKYNLSAFLSAARIVLQYALEEASGKAGGQKWYDDWISKNAILGFFRDKRDVNIHEKPIEPAIGITLTPTPATMRISAGLVEIVVRDTDGSIVSSEFSKPQPLMVSRDPTARIVATHRYSFVDWHGDNEVMPLVRMYLDTLVALVKDGIAMGLLTP